MDGDSFGRYLARALLIAAFLCGIAFAAIGMFAGWLAWG